MAASVAMAMAVALLGLAGPADASGRHGDRHERHERNDKRSIAGTGTPGVMGENGCDAGADFAMQITGDLDGCLSMFVETAECVPGDADNPDRYRETGTELFVGSHDVRLGNGRHRSPRHHHRHDRRHRESDGTFRTTYVVEATMAAGSGCDFAMQITGGCVHPIVKNSGTGQFDDVEGLLIFTDHVPSFPEPGWADFFALAGYLERDH